ncbi:MAG: Crp/Fnr family transcriptional regulator [Candidatus Sericytochromatia bacterium]
MLDENTPIAPARIGLQELKFWYFTKNELFFKIALQDIDWLSKVAHLDKTERGQVIYLPGQPASRVYILKQGRVRISRMSPQGKQITVAVLDSGTLFGEAALFEEVATHDNFAETLDDTWLCWISASDFVAFMHKHPELNYRIMKLVGKRMLQIENRLEDLVFLTVEQRLLKLLAKLAEDHGIVIPEGVLIGIRITHEEIGNLINATRPTVTEMLSRLQKEDWISICKRQIVLRPALLDQPDFSSIHKK